jgi:hypothetical protein
MLCRLSLRAGEMQVAANAVEFNYLLGSGLLVEYEIFARGKRGHLPDLFLGVLGRVRRAEPKHAAVLYLKNIERRTCHLYPRFTSFTDRDFFQRSLFLPEILRAFRCFLSPQFVGKDLLGDGQRDLGEMYFGPIVIPPSNTLTLSGLKRYGANLLESELSFSALGTLWLRKRGVE